MKEILGTVLLIILLTVTATLCSCAPEGPQPEMFPNLGQGAMIIPAGTKIGDIVTEKDGAYFQEDGPLEILVLPKGTMERVKIESGPRHI